VTHNDPALWAEYSRLAKQVDALRKKAAELACQPGFPDQLKAKASLLAYHLLQSSKEASQLAGDRPDGVKADDPAEAPNPAAPERK
jgi:hypothetical protein